VPIMALVAALASGRKPRRQAPQPIRSARIRSIEQDADVVMFVYRENITQEPRAARGTEELSPGWRKWSARMAAPRPSLASSATAHRNRPLAFEAEITRFSNLADEDNAAGALRGVTRGALWA